jgi:hypothetical protein
VSDKPNPGSDAALDLGCICAVLDNNHGRFPPYPAVPDQGLPEAWWITEGCPVHTPTDEP